MKRKNQKSILSYFTGLGDSLDQTQSAAIEKRVSHKVVRHCHFLKMVKSLSYSQKYGITLTFRPSWHTEDPLYLHRLISRKIASSRLWKKEKYILFPEYTENGILHYHGYIYDTYQTNVKRLEIWWKRTYGTITKIEYQLRYPYCGIQNKCIQKNKSKAKYCWLHYISKDLGKTGLWTITNL